MVADQAHPCFQAEAEAEAEAAVSQSLCTQRVLPKQNLRVDDQIDRLAW
jgi:hypothetical protein